MICGMFVKPYPAWIAMIQLDDGQQLFFDGPKDLFRYYFRMREKDGKAKISKIMVTEYYSAAPVNARVAFFVVGSDTLGPMGAELVPVSSREAAESFRKDHDGRKVLSFDEITPALIDSLP